MNVDKELREMKRRLDLGIERNYLIGMAHLEGMDPAEYAARIDAERLAAQWKATNDVVKQIGASYRRINDALVAAAESFARGWRDAGK